MRNATEKKEEKVKRGKEEFSSKQHNIVKGNGVYTGIKKKRRKKMKSRVYTYIYIYQAKRSNFWSKV